MLDKAYKLANERDLDRIKYLKAENNPASFDEIYSLYGALKARQSTCQKSTSPEDRRAGPYNISMSIMTNTWSKPKRKLLIIIMIMRQS